MFSLLANLTKAAVAVAVLPVDAVSDVLTLGGSLSDSGESAVAKRLEQAGKALDAAVKPEAGQCERAAVVAELREWDARSRRFVDVLTEELMAMSDEDILEGKDPEAIRAEGLALVARAKASLVPAQDGGGQ